MSLLEWENFEEECCDFLQKKYDNVVFELQGGHDSTKTDLTVLREGNQLFKIEVKMPHAQCGQFVLFTDEQKKEFIYSSQNKTPLNRYSMAIIKEMNKDFENLKKPSAANLDINADLFVNWIVSYYKDIKKASFMMTKGDGYILFPIEKLANYFNVTASYRIKKSGSSNPVAKNVEEIKDLLCSAGLNVASLFFTEKHLNVILRNPITLKTISLCGNKYNYFLRGEGKNFRITKLSNTHNANVIFSITLKSPQDIGDLKAFEKACGE